MRHDESDEEDKEIHGRGLEALSPPREFEGKHHKKDKTEVGQVIEPAEERVKTICLFHAQRYDERYEEIEDHREPSPHPLLLEPPYYQENPQEGCTEGNKRKRDFRRDQAGGTEEKRDTELNDAKTRP